jgi:hypothetical protein
MSAIMSAEDLSRYRKFQLGMDLATVAKETGSSRSQVKDVYGRPSLIQELSWRPQPLGSSSRTEPVSEVVFSFYDGHLFRIVVIYDRYDTEGLTADDFVEAISANYGIATKPAAAAATPGPYGDREEGIARWQDPHYRFDLVRSTYGPTYRLIGVAMNLEAAAQAAIIEGQRLDQQEAPQRDAERIAREAATEQAKLEKARLVNKARFRP